MSDPAARHDSYAPFRLSGFRWYIGSLLTATFGIQVQTLVVGWQVYEQTRDPLSLGLVGLAEALPFIGVALYAGHVADRMDRRTLSLLSLAVLLACSAVLLVFSLRPEIIAGGRVWPIYAVIFASGIGRSFLQPARTALGAEVVPRELYATSVAWRSSVWQSAAVLGPAVGGFLYAVGGAVLAYSVDVALMAVALLTMARIRHAPMAREAAASVAENLRVGLRFLRGQPVLLGALTLDMFAVLFGGAVALLPVFASEILHVGPQGLGLLRAAPAVGAVAMSVFLAHRPPMRHAGRDLLVSVALFGVCMIGFALSRSFMLSLALLALSGMVDNVSVVIRATLVTVLTPTNLLGRVSAVNSIFIGSSNEIGQFESGVAARLMGTVPSVVFGGTMTLLVVALMAWRVPELRRLGRLQ
ncbi:MAG TPA: MFS transporter [Longimicrobiaceae bacterium]|nr:MFS transporter [Longimicrobiaceae bacterium]